MVIVDIHAHCCDLRTPSTMGRAPLSMEALIERLDAEGVDRAVLLPWPACPEAVTFPGLFSPLPDVVSQVQAAGRHADRLIPFGNLDPRWGGNSPDADFRWLLERFIEMGCRGIGELGGNLWFDDPRVVNVVRQCGERGLPVLFESSGPGPGRYGLIDTVGSPRLERLLVRAPDTILIGHGPGFWAEIGQDLLIEEKSGYPSGPVGRGGSLQRLLRTYPNLYADLSAHSGYNALTRDPQHAARFLHEFSDRLLFGTDTCFADPEGRMPQLAYLQERLSGGELTAHEYAAIVGGNALRLLGIGPIGGECAD